MLSDMKVLKTLKTSHAVLMGKSSGTYEDGPIAVSDPLWSGFTHNLSDILPASLCSLKLKYTRIARNKDVDYASQLRRLFAATQGRLPLLKEITVKYDHEYSWGVFPLNLGVLEQTLKSLESNSCIRSATP